MAETLTQAEVDALREAVSSGKIDDLMVETAPTVAEEELKVVAYDFRKPKLLSAERMQTLQVLHQEFVKNLQGMLFSMFKITGEISLRAMDQVSYGEFALSLESPSYMLGLTSEPDVGTLGVEMMPPMGQVLLDMLLGGDGTSAAAEPAREFSDLEMDIMRTLSDRLLDELALAWKIVCDLSFSVYAQGVNTEQVQITTPDTPCLSVEIDIRIDDAGGGLHVCYPFNTLQTIFQRGEESRDAISGKRIETRQNVLRALHKVPLGIDVELGKARVTARELDALEVGDVLKLHRAVGDSLALNVGGRRIGATHVGAHRGRMAACVNRIVKSKKTAPPPKSERQIAKPGAKPNSETKKGTP